jgi:hypothetical protein
MLGDIAIYWEALPIIGICWCGGVEMHKKKPNDPPGIG